MNKLYIYIIIAFTLIGCSDSRGKFTLKGQIKHLDGGELYVYSAGGAIDRLDTIRLSSDGEFVYSTTLPHTEPLILLFQNASEQVVFATPGKSAKLKGDASHLRDIVVEGTDENELFTAFRHSIRDNSDDKSRQVAAEKFIREHKESLVSAYLLQRFFVDLGAEEQKQKELFSFLAKHQNSEYLSWLYDSFKLDQKAMKGSAAPQFSIKTMRGGIKSLKDFKGKYLLLTFTSSWAPPARNAILRQKDIQANNPSIRQLTVWLDVQPSDWERQQHNDSLSWNVALQTETFQSPIAQSYGVYSLPTFILIAPDAKIAFRSRSIEDMEKKIKELVK